MDQLYQIKRIMAEKFNECNGRNINGRKEKIAFYIRRFLFHL